MRLFLLDNYDSFTYNLVHLLSSITGQEITVQLNDEVDFELVAQHDRILLSPGPGLPSEAGQMPELIRRFASTHPILGVCLGHQALGEFFGGQLINLPTVHHGVSHFVSVENKVGEKPSKLFNGLPSGFEVGRYHSWAVEETSLPAAVKVTARDNDGVVMALEHQILDICGVQFHPESVLTPLGEAILRNWLNS
jgi:anthranilate synthase component 2